MTRRTVLQALASAAGAALVGLRLNPARAEPAPEITRIRLYQAPTVCLAPQYIAEELLRAEGFSEIEYPTPENPATIADDFAAGRIDIGLKTATYLVPVLDRGMPLVVLAGAHAGCYELFGNEKVQSVRDLKGKRVAISAFGASEHVFVSSMAAYVGLNPRDDIVWIRGKTLSASMDLYVQSKADAFLAFAPQPQQLRARGIGRVIVNTTHDRPWSQYFCCVVVGNRDFVAKHPVATKRALRAILKSSDLCADQPERTARYLADKGYEKYELALEVLRDLPYRRWRESDPEDTLRFHALRLREARMIKSDPNQLIARGTDWRFLNELKKELKA